MNYVTHMERINKETSSFPKPVTCIILVKSQDRNLVDCVQDFLYLINLLMAISDHY